jgi:CheY-like chemotaxis protein
MTQPLALVFYERLLPGSQIVNRLQDLNYRVQVVTDATSLVEFAEQAKPMIVLADLTSTRSNVGEALSRLRQNSATQHLPIIAFSTDSNADTQTAAQAAGASLIVGEAAILNHLPQVLEQALQID